MAPPFDERLAILTLEELQAFLDRELEEGLTWEAKGSREIRATQVRKAVSGFANARGGSLILGAEADGGAWKLPGHRFPGGEASTWLSSVIGDLAPVPRHDVKVLPTSTDGQPVAVVAVEPIDVPPCMSDGSVFVRVSGQTVPVRDPTVLQSLFEQGRVAGARGLELAQETARAIYTRPLEIVSLPFVTEAEKRPPGRSAFGLGLAPLGWPAACYDAVRRESFAAKLEELLHTREIGGLSTGHSRLSVSRRCVQQLLRTHYGTWVIRVDVRGAAAVTFMSELLLGDARDAPVRIPDVMSELPNAWSLAADALHAAGASGEALLGLHLQSTLSPSPEGWRVSPTPTMDVVRAVELGPPTDPELDSIKRELEREAGYPSFEPEPEP